jgi:excisionase family DNA binding protein
MRNKKQQRPTEFSGLPVSEAARYLGKSQSGIKWLLKTGKLSGCKFGRSWVVSLESLKSYFDSRRKA